MSCLVASRNFSQAVSFKVDVLNWSGDFNPLTFAI